MKYNIDLHVHTKFSGDTNAEPEETVHIAIRKGLHGIAFTEHYSYDASEYAEKLRETYRDNITIFRGVEYSAYEGHCLIFGINSDKILPKNATIVDIIPLVVRHGGVIMPSHPFRGGNSIGEPVRYLKGIHAIEGFNGYTHHSQNMKAISVAKSMALPYTGGSDAHEAHEVGACYTEFYEPVTEDNFLYLLKNGNYSGVDTRKISRAWVF